MHDEENLNVRRKISCYNCRVLIQKSIIKQFCFIYFYIRYNAASDTGRLIVLIVIFKSLSITGVPTSEIK
jgi:hypothetical protein